MRERERERDGKFWKLWIENSNKEREGSKWVRSLGNFTLHMGNKGGGVVVRLHMGERR